MPNARRMLAPFQDFQSVERDLDQLLAQGYSTAGNWTLAQTCEHLRDWLGYPLDGFPRAPFPINVLLSLMRVTVGKKAFRNIIATGSMKAKQPTLRQTVHTQCDVSDQDAVQRLKQAIARFDSYQGEIKPSPVFGAMNHTEARQLQLVHLTHHLSFLIPKQSS